MPEGGGEGAPDVEKDGSKGHGSRIARAFRGSSAYVALHRTVRSLRRMQDRLIDCGAASFHIGLKILGPIFVCLALSLIGFVTYTYFVYALPAMKGGPVRKCAISVSGVVMLGNLLYNYGKSVCTDAGCPPEWEKVHVEMEADAQEQVGPPPKKCLRCSRLKPPRAHHCSVCRRCVLKMDHHCPWINNCVGFGNYRHFCLFMLYLWLGCLFVILVFLDSFWAGIFHMGYHRRIDRTPRQCIMMAFMLCVSILISLCILGGFHVYLVLTNQTTIEFQTNLYRRREARKNGEYYQNPYDMGRGRNFKQVFGPNPFCRLLWLFPYMAAPLTGNGIQFPSVSRLKV